MFQIVVPLLAAFVLVWANGIFVAAEFSLVAVDRDRVERAAAAGNRRARGVLRALHTLSFQLSGAQLGITLCTLLVGYLAEPAIRRLLAPQLQGLPVVAGAGAAAAAAAVAIAVSSGVLIVAGELIPKNAAVAHPEGTARLVVGAQRGFSAFFRPLVTALNRSANRVVRAVGVEPREEVENVRTADELALLVTSAARAGTVGASTAAMARRSLRFGEQRADEVMTPRVDLIAVDKGTTVEQLLAVARETGLSRFPVYGRNPDDVVGMTSVKAALGVPVGQRDTTRVGTIARTPLLVPDSVTADAVLGQLRQADTQLAVVVDEYGGTAGIVTLEDLTEELVGQVADEYDRPVDRSERARVWGGSPIVDVPGATRPAELAEWFDIHIPEGSYDTVAGFLLDRFERLPGAGESVDYGRWRFTVLRRNRQRIGQVRIEPQPEGTEGGTDEGTDEGTEGER